MEAIMANVTAYRAKNIEGLSHILSEKNSRKWEYLIISGVSDLQYVQIDFGGQSKVFQLDIEQRSTQKIKKFS
jgi:hypothetical protein